MAQHDSDGAKRDDETGLDVADIPFDPPRFNDLPRQHDLPPTEKPPLDEFLQKLSERPLREDPVDVVTALHEARAEMFSPD